MKAKGFPTRRPTTRPLRRCLAAATLFAATLTACTGGSILNTKEVEASVRSQFQIDDQFKETGATRYFATCPVEIPDTLDYLFQCRIKGYKGGGFTLSVGDATVLVQVLYSGQVHVLGQVDHHRYQPAPK